MVGGRVVGGSGSGNREPRANTREREPYPMEPARINDKAAGSRQYIVGSATGSKQTAKASLDFAVNGC